MSACPERAPEAWESVVGASPALLFEPRTAQDCVAALRESRARRMALAFVGGGTALGLGRAPERLDALLSTRRLDRVLEHAPEDQVVSVEAGVTLAALQATLRPHRQRLACDAPAPHRQTIGGLLAAGDFGPLRARYGPPRDLVIGMSMVRADGTWARGGGKVVKNVAGFDLPKLMVGALGTLGLIARVTLRLHPLPEAAVTVRARGVSAQDVRARVVALRHAQLEPAAVVAVASASPFDLLARFEGSPEGVSEQCDRAQAILGGDAEVLAAAEATLAWADHDARRTAGDTRCKLSIMPSELPTVLSAIVPRLAAHLARPAIVGYPTLGLLFLGGDLVDAGGLARGVDEARRTLAERRGSLVVQEAPPALRAAIDVWGPPPAAAFELMKRVKARFDPERRLSPGRFVGGL